MSSYAEIVKEIQSGKYAPVYFLQGEETFFIDNIIDHIESSALEESQKSFNQAVVYGKDTTLTEIIGTARKYPMMGERQVVIVKEAQELKGWTKEDQQTLVLSYLENPLMSTILVFGYKYKSLDKRTKLGKAFEKKAIFLNAKKLYDNEIPGWIQAFCRASRIEIENEAVMMLTENIGNNLQRLANEINKLIINLSGQPKINAAMVQRYVGINKDYNIFELQKAIGVRNKQRVFKIINYFSSNPSNNPLVLIIFSLFSYFTKLLLIHHSSDKNEKAVAGLIGVNPYFAKEYLQAARNYPIHKIVENIHHLGTADLESKGINAATKKEGAILTELAYKLLS